MFTCLVLFKIWHVLCHHCRCIESSLESTPWFFPSASPVTSRLTFSFTCQLISIIITTLIIHHSFTVSLQAQNLPFQQMLPTLDFFYLPDCLHDNGTGPGLSCSSFYFQFHIFIGHRRCAYYIFRRWGFIYLFLWPPYSPALVNGSSRKFYTWWTLSVIRELTTWIFSWSSLNYRKGQKVTKFGVFSYRTRKLSAFTSERGKIL